MFNNIGMTIGELSTGQRDITEAGVFLGMGALNSFSPLGFGQGDNIIELGYFADRAQVSSRPVLQYILYWQPDYQGAVPIWNASTRVDPVIQVSWRLSKAGQVRNHLVEKAQKM